MPNEAITEKLSEIGKSFHHEVAFYSICPTMILATKLREYRNLGGGELLTVLSANHIFTSDVYTESSFRQKRCLFLSAE